MNLAICGSLVFAKEMDDLRNKLKELGFDVKIPYTAEKILSGQFSREEIEKKKESGSFFRLTRENDAIRRWFDVIKSCDAILVANYDKNNIKYYIGGSAFLEIGFAHVLGKKIFLYNPIPEVSYKDEILAMQPVVLDGDLIKIR
jgi:hypothetical protein